MEQLIKEVKHKSAEYSQNFNAINVFFRQLNNNTEFGMIIDCNNLLINFVFSVVAFRRNSGDFEERQLYVGQYDEFKFDALQI